MSNNDIEEIIRLGEQLITDFPNFYDNENFRYLLNRIKELQEEDGNSNND